MMPRRHPTTGRDDGFTLVEVLVAFTIVTILLSGVMKLFSAGLFAAERARTYNEALLLAESSLDQVGTAVALRDGDVTDRVDERFTRRIRISRRPEQPSNQTRSAAPPKFIPYDVAVTVTWQSGLRSGAVTLESVRLSSSR